jgi:hypothetical protein
MKGIRQTNRLTENSAHTGGCLPLSWVPWKIQRRTCLDCGEEAVCGDCPEEDASSMDVAVNEGSAGSALEASKRRSIVSQTWSAIGRRLASFDQHASARDQRLSEMLQRVSLGRTGRVFPWTTSAK